MPGLARKVDAVSAQVFACCIRFFCRRVVLQIEPPGGLREAWDKLPIFKQVMAMKPKSVGKAPCQEVVLTGADIDLSALPVQTCWPGEPAPLVTWPLVVTRGPTSTWASTACR